MAFFSDEEDKGVKFIRRVSYYLHWRSEQIGKVKAAEVMGIHRDTLRKWCFYNFMVGSADTPKPSLNALYLLADFVQDELPLVFYAAQYAAGFNEFQALISQGSIHASFEPITLKSLLQDSGAASRKVGSHI